MQNIDELPNLLTPEQVKATLGLKTVTNHTLRSLEKRGLLLPIRLNARTLRYDARDVMKLIADGRSA